MEETSEVHEHVVAVRARRNSKPEVKTPEIKTRPVSAMTTDDFEREVFPLQSTEPVVPLTFKLSDGEFKISSALFSKHIMVAFSMVNIVSKNETLKAYLQRPDTQNFDAQLAVITSFVPRDPNSGKSESFYTGQLSLDLYSRVCASNAFTGMSAAKTSAGEGQSGSSDYHFANREVFDFYFKALGFGAIACSYPGYSEYERLTPQEVKLQYQGREIKFNRDQPPLTLSKPKDKSSVTRASISSVTFTFAQVFGWTTYSALISGQSSFRTLYVDPFTEASHSHKATSIMTCPAMFNMYWNSKYMVLVTMAALAFQHACRRRYNEAREGKKTRFWCDIIYKSSSDTDRANTMYLVEKSVGADAGELFHYPLTEPRPMRKAPELLRKHFGAVVTGSWDGKENEDVVDKIKDLKKQIQDFWDAHFNENPLKSSSSYEEHLKSHPFPVYRDVCRTVKLKEALGSRAPPVAAAYTSSSVPIGLASYTAAAAGEMTPSAGSVRTSKLPSVGNTSSAAAAFFQDDVDVLNPVSEVVSVEDVAENEGAEEEESNLASIRSKRGGAKSSGRK